MKATDILKKQHREVKGLFKKSRKSEAPPPPEPPPQAVAGLLPRVHEVAFKTASEFLPKSQATMLANAVVGELALEPAPKGA